MKVVRFKKEEGGKTLHKLHVVGTNDDLWDEARVQTPMPTTPISVKQASKNVVAERLFRVLLLESVFPSCKYPSWTV